MRQKRDRDMEPEDRVDMDMDMDVDDQESGDRDAPGAGFAVRCRRQAHGPRQWTGPSRPEPGPGAERRPTFHLQPQPVAQEEVSLRWSGALACLRSGRFIEKGEHAEIRRRQSEGRERAPCTAARGEP